VRQQKLLGELNGQVEEMVTSYKTVVAYGKERKATKEFDEVSAKLRKCSAASGSGAAGGAGYQQLSYEPGGPDCAGGGLYELSAAAGAL